MSYKLLEDVSKVLEQRGKKYPPYREESDKISLIWNILFPTGKISPENTALFLVVMKLVRESNGHDRDNALDMVGYLEKYDELMGRK